MPVPYGGGIGGGVGPAGPQGPMGQQGPTGPQGSVGAIGPQGPGGLMMKVGKYFANGFPVNAGAGSAKSNGDMVGTRVSIGRACTLDAIACEVTAAGSAGALVRLGIYDDDNGIPLAGLPRLDAGTIDASTTGVKVAAISHVLAVGSYWLVAALQGGAATRPDLRTVTLATNAMAFGALDFRFSPAQLYLSATGALPDGSVLTTNAANIMYMVLIKASA